MGLDSVFPKDELEIGVVFEQGISAVDSEAELMFFLLGDDNSVLIGSGK